MLKGRAFALTSAVLASAAISTLAMAMPASAADGSCANTDFCAFRNYDRHKNEGVYDLGSPVKDFKNLRWFNASGSINDDISSYTAMTGTSCAGYRLFWDKDHVGQAVDIPKGWGGNLAGAASPHNNEFSSYSKYGCP
ncbi:hypothetical protein [Streptomyces sp. MS2.AVA.5]|uniref:Uncharacterized protein n=1 Tax=Streptomyces achmelvichensis TaxID=3134111 RepID=A0ACC6PZN5_9ACTN